MTLSAQSIYDMLPDLLRSLPGAETCQFLELAVPPSMEHRPGATPELASLAAKARLVQGPDDSFTETLMSLAARENQSQAVLAVAQFHQPLIEALAAYELDIQEVTAESLRALGSRVPSNRMLVITSQVGTSAGIRHMPLVDFKLAAAPENHDAVRAAARRLGDGQLVVSGSSYHFYGQELLTTEALVAWLLRAQLLSRYIDTRWVTHQLIEQRCALRISRGGGANAIPVLL